MNIAVFYVPSLITDNQKRWLDINLNNFKGYEYISFNNYSEVDGKVIEEKIEDFDIELSIINKRYLDFRKSLEEGRVIIVPDEEQIEDDLFEGIIVDSENHVDRYQDFSNKYHLGYKFSKDDFLVAPLTMASLGHFCYNTVEGFGNIIIDIPKTVTKRQYDYFINNKEMILKYSDRKATISKNIDGKFIIEELDGLDLIEKEVKKRYEEYKKKSEDKGNVR